MFSKKVKRQKIHRKIRTRISGTAKCPRLSIFRSANHIYAQLIDDENSKIIASVSDLKLKSAKSDKTKRSIEVGKLIASKALDKKIEKVVFDR